MRKLIFREGNGVCSLNSKDRWDTVYHILNGCDRICPEYIVRRNLIVNRLVESINLNCRIIGEVQEDKQIKIIATEDNNDKPFHSQVRSDIWYWTD
jgi:hypothetical protein